MSTERIKIGQIGVCHEHASGKILSLKKMPEIFDIVGVVNDRETSSAARFAGDDLSPYEGLKFVTEEELFHTPGLRAVMVETPNLELVPAAIRCLEHRLPVHMDKPGGEDLALFAGMRNGFAERGLPFQMGYMFRGNPAIQWCVKAVRRGWLGDILEAQADMNHDYGGEAYQEYLGRFGGGIMFNLGCHLIDVIVAMLGAPRKIAPFLKNVPGDPETVRNNCLAVLEYPHAAVTLRAHSRAVGGLDRRRLKICGTKGMVELCPLERFDGQALTMCLTLRDGNEEYTAGTHLLDFGIIRDRYEAQLREFAEIIRGNTPDIYGYEHDYLVQKALLAASGYAKWNE
jgi:predicted dehydrogenase